MAGGHLPVFVVLAQELSDADATRRVLLTAGGLLLIGVVLLVATVWWWRSTRPDHPVLAPLEIMGERRWMRADPEQRRMMVDASRPAGALPVVADAARPEPNDLELPEPSAPPAPDDLAELDRLLGLVPDRPDGVAVAPAAVDVDQHGDERVGAAGEADRRHADQPAFAAAADGAGSGTGSQLGGFDEDLRRPGRDAGDDAGRQGHELFESDPADVRHPMADDPDGGGRGAIDPLLQRTSAVAED